MSWQMLASACILAITYFIDSTWSGPFPTQDEKRKQHHDCSFGIEGTGGARMEAPENLTVDPILDPMSFVPEKIEEQDIRDPLIHAIPNSPNLNDVPVMPPTNLPKTYRGVVLPPSDNMNMYNNPSGPQTPPLLNGHTGFQGFSGPSEPILSNPQGSPGQQRPTAYQMHPNVQKPFDNQRVNGNQMSPNLQGPPGFQNPADNQMPLEPQGIPGYQVPQSLPAFQEPTGNQMSLGPQEYLGLPSPAAYQKTPSFLRPSGFQRPIDNAQKTPDFHQNAPDFLGAPSFQVPTGNQMPLGSQGTPDFQRPVSYQKTPGFLDLPGLQRPTDNQMLSGPQGNSGLPTGNQLPNPSAAFEYAKPDPHGPNLRPFPHAGKTQNFASNGLSGTDIYYIDDHFDEPHLPKYVKPSPLGTICVDPYYLENLDPILLQILIDHSRKFLMDGIDQAFMVVDQHKDRGSGRMMQNNKP